MRTLILIAAILAFSSVSAETVFIEATQDNTLYETPNGTLSNGVGSHMFVGRTRDQEIRRGLVAFKNLSAIPPGAFIQSVKLHMFLSKENSPSTTINLLRASSDWGASSSDAVEEEGGGANSQPGDATWVHAFFNEVVWNNLGGDFVEVASEQRTVDGAGAYTFGSTSAMRNDVADWLADPDSNFGWFLIGGETSLTSKRFDSREHFAAANRPTLEVRYSMPTVFDFSGIWFDPELDGEGYLLFNTPFGWLVYFFGYRDDGTFLWVTSDLVEVDQVTFGQPIVFPMLVGAPGTFAQPSPSSLLVPYGTLTVVINGCSIADFTLDGDDGVKASSYTKLVGIEGTQCLEVR